MTLLDKDTETQTDAPQGEDPAAQPPVAAACPKCGAPVEDGQDWCLNCGEAQASRRISLPGKRAAATVLALTTVLVGGAVAASYAAIKDDPATSTTPTQLAQVPAPTPSAATPAPTTPAPTAAVPSDTAPPPTSSTATPPAVSDTAPPVVDSTPVTPPASSTPSIPSTGSGTGTSTGSTKTGDDSSSKGDSTADTRTSTTPAETAPVAIKLDESAAALYDPFKRDTAAGDPTKALDGDPGTSFPVTVAPGSPQIGAGLTVDLGEKQGVREVDVTTKTPGFKIEIYATDETDLPPDVLDTRWAHLKDVSGVGTDTDGKVKVSLGSGTSKYRHVLLWFTAPPTDGSTVRISELKILG